MEYCKATPSSFQYRFKSVATYTTPKLDATLYHQLLGIILYSTHAHPKISFVVGIVSWHLQTPYESHWKIVEMILWYIWDTIQFGIHYSLVGNYLLVGFTNSDSDGDLMMKRIIHIVFYFMVLDLSFGIIIRNKAFISLW
jgi:hypothetical protein